MNIIFDFDGTLGDTTKYFHDMANTIAERYNYPHISDEQYERARDSTPRDMLKEMGIPMRALPKLQKASHQVFAEHKDEIAFFEGLTELVRELSENHTLGILTSNDAALVVNVIERLKLDQHFMFINSAVSVLGKHRALNKILKRHKMDKADTIYIGDQIRDVEGAKKVGIPCIAVTWGFNTERILLEEEPEYVARTPQDLKEILQKLAETPK